MTNFRYDFGAASQRYNLLSRAAYVLGLDEDAGALLKRVCEHIAEPFAHEDFVRQVSALLSLDSSEKLSVHSRIDMMCHEEEGCELRSLVGNSPGFTNKCEEIFDGFSSDLSAAQQVYAVLYVAEFLLGAFDVGYGARSVHDVKDLEDLAEPSDDELGCEQALGEFYL